MDRRLLGAVLLGIILVVVGIGAVLYTGYGPAPGGDSGDHLTAFPTATATEQGPDSAGSVTATSPAPLPFAFTIDAVEKCGQTCRDVTATLHNNRDEPATGVTVFTRIFAGRNNSDTDDLVWEGKEEVGTLEAGGDHTTTERVELSLQEGLKIQRNDGWITIVTTVRTDQRTVTFRNTEQVA